MRTRVGHELFQITGTALNTCNQAMHLRWLQEHEPQSVARTAAAWFPAPMGAVVPEVLRALLDAPAREAFGWAPAHPVVDHLTDRTLRLAARLKATLPPRRRPSVITAAHHRSYPQGYTIEGLGPPDLTGG